MKRFSRGAFLLGLLFNFPFLAAIRVSCSPSCRSPEWCLGEQLSGAGAHLDIKTNPSFG